MEGGATKGFRTVIKLNKKRILLYSLPLEAESNFLPVSLVRVSYNVLPSMYLRLGTHCKLWISVCAEILSLASWRFL